MTLCDVSSTSRATRASRAPGHHPRPKAQVELALLVALYVVYCVGRLLGHAGPPAATAHARDLLHVEDLLHIDFEQTANEVLENVPLLALIGSYWYALLHYIVTPGVLFWAYRAEAAALPPGAQRPCPRVGHRPGRLHVDPHGAATHAARLRRHAGHDVASRLVGR